MLSEARYYSLHLTVYIIFVYNVFQPHISRYIEVLDTARVQFTAQRTDYFVDTIHLDAKLVRVCDLYMT